MKVLDLFSGVGMFSLGLQRAGFETVAFVEIAPYCRSILARHWPTARVYHDVRTVTGTGLAADGIFPDLICGGFPCQDISLAGNGAGLAGERSGLWWKYARIIAEITPPWIIIENVPALRSRGLDDVLGCLDALGYDAQWHCIPACAVGAPHRRDRVWIVACAARQRCAEAWKNCQRYPRWLASGGEALADADDAGRHRRAGIVRVGARVPQPSHRSGDMGNADSARLAFWEGFARDLGEELAAIERTGRRPGGWWFAEPGMGRVAHGVANRVDRLRALGNGLMPQIAEAIGRTILAAS